MINIKDAYKDHQIDHPTGYKIKSIICMSMLIWDSIIGLVKMGNKVHGCFTALDEYAIEMYAVYWGWPCFTQKRIQKWEDKYKVMLGVLSYHCSATIIEIRELKQCPIPASLPSNTLYSFLPWGVPDSHKSIYCFYMFQKLFTTDKFDLDVLVHFTLAVCKKYCKVPYHN